jgi:transposase
MNDNTIFIGVDISKSTFDVSFNGKGHLKFDNDSIGFEKFFDCLKANHWCVMEATGSYHLNLACFLNNHGVQLSVVNPLVIKRFAQMKLRMVKTDKADAEMIASYGKEQLPEPWQPPSDHIFSCQQLESTIALFIKQSTSLCNKIHNLESATIVNKYCLKTLKLQLKRTKIEIKKLEIELENLIKVNQSKLYSNIKSIQGIGVKTAIKLIVTTGGFENFNSAKQVVSYFGLAPSERSSGSSIRGRSRITKRGQSVVRNHLFMCSFTACQHNPQCKELYDRITAKGKSKKLALIAVCNKLIKQAFAVAKSGIPYDPNYKSPIPKV